MTTVKCHINHAGYCLARRSHVLRGTKSDTIRFYATYAHIEHPEHGHILFDTGYTKRFYQATRKFPESLYAQITKVFVLEDEEVVSRLRQKGVEPDEVNHIIVSHFHGDHVGGLKDFPSAKFVYSKKAYQSVRGRRGFRAVLKGYLPELLPLDFEARSEPINPSNSTYLDAHLGPMTDLFNDGSILLGELSGHAEGMLVALLKTQNGPVLLASDAAWLRENFQNRHLPSPLARIILSSWSDFTASLDKLHQFSKANPDTFILPCHCEASFEAIQHIQQS